MWWHELAFGKLYLQSAATIKGGTAQGGGGHHSPSGWERILGQGHFHPPTCAGATIRAQKIDKSKTIYFDKVCTGHFGTSLLMGHPEKAGTIPC